MTANIFETVRGIASDLFGIPGSRITDRSSPETVDAWDSTQHLNFVLALEETFHIQLAPEEMEQMRTIGDIVRLVKHRLQNVAG